MRDRVRRCDGLLDQPAVDHQRSRRPRAAAQRRDWMCGPGQPHQPVAQRADRERDGHQRHAQVGHVALKFVYMRPARGVGQRDEMLDRGDGAVLEKPRHQRARQSGEEPLGDRFDNAVKTRQPEERQRQGLLGARAGGGCRRAHQQHAQRARRRRRHRSCVSPEDHLAHASRQRSR